MVVLATNNAVLQNGETALFVAMRRGNLEALQDLVGAGADTDIENLVL